MNKSLGNLLTLLYGSASSKAIAILSIPIISRLYTPEDFGYFTFFISLITIISAISGLGFPVSLLKYREQWLVNSIVKLCFISSVIVSVFSIVIIFLLIFFDFLILPVPIYVVFLIPICVLLILFIEISVFVKNRDSNFRDISLNSFISSFFSNFTKIFFGYLFFANFTVLLLTTLATNIVQLVVLNYKSAKNLINKCNLQFFDSISIENYRKVFNLLSDFPKFRLPQTLVFYLNSYFVVMFGVFIFNPDEIGQFGLAVAILSGPLALISNSITQIIYPIASNASSCKIKHSKYLVFLKKFGLYSALMMPVVIFLAFEILPLIITFILGSKWLIAADLSVFILISAIGNLFFSPFSSAIVSYGLEKQLFFFELLSVVGKFLIFLFLHFNSDNMDFRNFVILSSLFNFMIYFVFSYFIFFKLKFKGYNNE